MKPMTCEMLRNTLLAEPNPVRLPAELRGHFVECAPCSDFLRRFRELNAELAVLPAPDSNLRKHEFLMMLESAGPIIKSIPASRSGTFVPVRSWSRRMARPMLAMAACVAVGIGLWNVMPSSRKPASESPYARHELLEKLVRHNAVLAKADPADARTKFDTLTALVGDLEAETRNVLLAASPEDLVALAGMFETVIDRGLVKHAEGMNRFTDEDRSAILRNAAAKLAITADSISALSRTAAAPSQAALDRMHKAATDGKHTLNQLAAGVRARS
jgi:hypothetical protein